MELIKIDNAETFWYIIEKLRQEFEEEGEGFYTNRDHILNSYVKGTLYGAIEIDRDFETVTWRSVLPAFAIKAETPQDYRDVFLWVDWSVRRRGVGRFLVNQLGINHVNSLPESLTFWLKMGFEVIQKYNGYVEMRLPEHDISHAFASLNL